jgi:hypothetical protein
MRAPKSKLLLPCKVLGKFPVQRNVVDHLLLREGYVVDGDIRIYKAPVCQTLKKKLFSQTRISGR